MASVYILYSSRLDKYYIGSCQNFETRLEQHHNKFFKNSFTSYSSDWEVFIVWNDLEYNQARSIEKHIKKMKSKVYLQNLKKHPEIFENLIQIHRVVGSSR